MKNILLLLSLFTAPLSIFAICGTSVTLNYKSYKCYANSDTISVLVSNGRYPYTYQWSPVNGSDSVLVVSNGGAYTVTVTDANTCTASASAVINSDAQIYCTSIVHLNACENPPYANLMIYGNGGDGRFVYKLIGARSDTTGLFTNLSSGNYIITISDSVGCVFADTVLVPKFINSFNFNVEADSVSCSGAGDGTIIITPLQPQYEPYQYEIDGNFQSDSIISNLTAGPHRVGVFSDSVTSCLPPDTVVIVPNSANVCTGVWNLSAETKLILYPNPATNLLMVNYENQNVNSKGAILEIFDELGQRLYLKSLDNSKTAQQIDVSAFANGFYVLRIKQDGAIVACSKFSKQ